MASEAIAALRRTIVSLEAGGICSSQRGKNQGFYLGEGSVDSVLGSLEYAAYHEVFAGEFGDTAATIGFTAGLIQCANSTDAIIWTCQRFAYQEAGRLYPSGLTALGIDPARFVFIPVKDSLTALCVAADALRCSSIGAVVIETWGPSKAFDLTATRRLSLVAAEHGVLAVGLRLGMAPVASTSNTRWSIRAQPSIQSITNEPGLPVYEATLLKSRKGVTGQWLLEWNYATGKFKTASALPNSMVPFSGNRQDLQTKGHKGAAA